MPRSQKPHDMDQYYSRPICTRNIIVGVGPLLLRVLLGVDVLDSVALRSDY